MGMTEGIMPVMDVSPSNDTSGFGGGVWIFFLFMLLTLKDGGLGNNDVAQKATLADLNNISNQINGVNKGLYDGFYAQNTTLLNGFTGVNAGITDLGYRVQSCCCSLGKDIESIRYENSKNTCDIITNANMNTRDLLANQTANTQRMVDLFTQDKIESLRTELQSAQLQLSHLSLTDAIINGVKPCPSTTCSVPPHCGHINNCNNGCRC